MSAPTFEHPFTGADNREHIRWTHECKNGPLTDTLPIDHELGWSIGQRDPLTLAPSLLCPVCGTHGFIRNGRWESA